MNRNRLYAGVSIFAALLVILGLSVLPSKKQPRINQRIPITKLAYCSANAVRPCVVSFSLDAKGRMLVNVLNSSSSFPKLYLKITHVKGESRYECNKMKGFPMNVICRGQELLPGETLQFVLAKVRDDAILAQGSFPIVGLALATPAEALTPTPTATPDLLKGTPGTPRSTPVLTPGTPPSYPNPYP